MDEKCHFDSSDLYKIENITDEFLRDKADELRSIVKKYFVGNADIPNP